MASKHVSPTPRTFAARGGNDDRVHLVDATDAALIDPSPYRTRCGQAVLAVYNTGRPATCDACGDRSR